MYGFKNYTKSYHLTAYEKITLFLTAHNSLTPQLPNYFQPAVPTYDNDTFNTGNERDFEVVFLLRFWNHNQCVSLRNTIYFL